MSLHSARQAACLILCLATHSAFAATTEFCLEGELDLGARYQGWQPGAAEFVDSTFCVISENGGERVRFHGEGKSNPDMHGEFTVAFIPPDAVRIVNRDSPPDLEFRPVLTLGSEAAAWRRLDPRRVVETLDLHPEWQGTGPGDGWRIVRYPGAAYVVALRIADGRLAQLRTKMDMPLRGTVPVTWYWDWPAPERPEVQLVVDGRLVFRGHGRWRTLTEAEAAATWQPSGGAPPRRLPGDAWPARVSMERETLADGVYLVHGVRTGFSHLVVDTAKGLVVGDAPAGWVELLQVPPADLVPGLGVSGLSEHFVDFLRRELPDRPLRAVALTHHHDDHAGGARAFAAAGAAVFAPATDVGFVESALNRETMPADRLAVLGRDVDVQPVRDSLLLADDDNAVRLVSLGAGPHAHASLGLHAVDAGFFFQSDLHVPGADPGEPRADRAATECWFAAWASENLPPDTVVVGSHGNPRTPVTVLAGYAGHERCRD